MTPTLTILEGDNRKTIAEKIPDGSVDLCMTSPPYFGQRDYGTRRWEGGDPACQHEGSERYYTEKTASVSAAGAFTQPGEANKERLKQGRWREAGICTKCGAQHVDAQIGLEKTVEAYVAELVALFALIRTKLKPDGTLWLNLGDGYNSGPSGTHKKGPGLGGTRQWRAGSSRADGVVYPTGHRNRNGQSADGYKQKDLMMIPARVALALQADGWWLRASCPWIKRNGMPDSSKGRPTQTIETLFMLTKSADAFYDYEAVKLESSSERDAGNSFEGRQGGARDTTISGGDGSIDKWEAGTKRARRATDFFFETWQGMLHNEEDGEPIAFVVNTAPFRDAHFATYPEKLVKPCVLSSSRLGGVVLDPFGGSGTTAKVALELGRSAILCELNPEYIEIARQRCQITPGLHLQ